MEGGGVEKRENIMLNIIVFIYIYIIVLYIVSVYYDKL